MSNPITYASLVSSRPPLAPVGVDIEGLSAPLLIHTFNLSDYAKVLDVNGMDDERGLKVKVLRLLGGLDAETGDDAIEKLDNIFSMYQLREIYLKGLKLNGDGPKSLSDAEKK